MESLRKFGERFFRSVFPMHLATGYVEIEVRDAFGNITFTETQTAVPVEEPAQIQETCNDKALGIYKSLVRKTFKKNQSLLLARKCHAHLMAKDIRYGVSRMEWGWGSAPAQRSNSDLDKPFQTRVFTPVTNVEYVTVEENAVRFTSTLPQNVTPVFPDPGSGGPDPTPSTAYVRELLLRTDPIIDAGSGAVIHPLGLPFARVVLSNDTTKDPSNTITARWVYVFA